MLRRLFGGPKADPAPVDSRPPAELIVDALGRLDRGEDEFAVFTADEGRNYYVQVTVLDGSLLGEAVADHYLAPAHRLGAAAQAQLEALGWTLADAGSDRNHSRTWADWHGARIRSVADELVATLIEVYQMEPNGPLEVLTDS
jgi:hypothetical protein